MSGFRWHRPFGPRPLVRLGGAASRDRGPDHGRIDTQGTGQPRDGGDAGMLRRIDPQAAQGLVVDAGAVCKMAEGEPSRIDQILQGPGCLTSCHAHSLVSAPGKTRKIPLDFLPETPDSARTQNESPTVAFLADDDGRGGP